MISRTSRDFEHLLALPKSTKHRLVDNCKKKPIAQK